MTDLDKYKNAFLSTFPYSRGNVSTYEYQQTVGWDSVGQMILVSTIEESFHVIFSPDEILLFKSYDLGIQILSEKGIKF